MIRIVTDSLADLPQHVIDEFNITLIPSYVTFGSQTLRDRIDLQPAEFFQLLADSTDLPVTSQASVHDFEAVYHTILDDNPEAQIISMHCSSSLSGSIESGRQALALMRGAPVQIFDTRQLSLGQGLMVIEAARMAAQGASVAAIMARLDLMRAGMASYFTLDTLDYLYKGGRIGRAARLMGSLLDMKPLLKFEDGMIAPDDRHRSRERAVEAMSARIVERCRNDGCAHLGIAHAACEQEALALASEMQSRLNPKICLIGEVGPAIGTYTGPGALGLFAWSEP